MIIRVRISYQRAATGPHRVRSNLSRAPIIIRPRRDAMQCQTQSTHPIGSCNIFASSRLWLEPGRQKSPARGIANPSGSATNWLLLPPPSSRLIRHVIQKSWRLTQYGRAMRTRAHNAFAPVPRPPASDQPVVFLLGLLVLPADGEEAEHAWCGFHACLACRLQDCSSLLRYIFRVFNGG